MLSIVRILLDCAAEPRLGKPFMRDVFVSRVPTVGEIVAYQGDGQVPPSSMRVVRVTHMAVEAERVGDPTWCAAHVACEAR